MMRRTFRNCTTRSSSKFGSVTVVVILAGKYATHRKWIHREIQIAQTEYEHKKPILGVEPWGSRQISSVVREAADRLVGWNTDSIRKGHS